MIVTDDRIAKFVSEQIGVSIVPPFASMGIERDGEIKAGVIFNHFEGSDVHVTVAGHGWTRGFFAEVGHYVFDTLQCVRMTAVTEQPQIVRIAERLGGQVEGRLRNHFGEGRDAYLVGVLKGEYRF